MKPLAAALLCAATLPLTGLVSAQTCEVTVNANDALQFDVREIVVDKGCPQYTVVLNHTGKMPVNVMGHNWVLTTEADFTGTARDAVTAGPANGYLPAGDTRVIAHTAMIGGGQQSTVTFDPQQLNPDEDYTFFCSFPGHAAIMKGRLRLGE